jgi:ubiquinone/menaquinone biosynthesis C-methylase UbiE
MNNTITNTPTFSGSIPNHYDEYLGPMFFEDYAVEVSSRIDPSKVHDALELSCGTGRVTNHLRKILPASARFIASDISPDMLTVAKSKLSTQNVDWRIIDANRIPFDDNSLDLIVCCFGYMFVDDKVKGFAEALRVLRPGGMLLISTWDKLEYNAASQVFRKIVKKYFGDSLPDLYKLPFSMHDPSLIQEQMRLAGFSKVDTEVVDKNSVCATAKVATYGLVQGGSLYNEIIKRNPDWLDEIKTNVERELSEQFGAAPMVAPMRAIITQAWK